MNLLPTPEQDQITESVRAFLTKELPTAQLREPLPPDGTPDERTWRRCAELGWLGLGLDAAAGGVGYGPAEETLLFRELGRHLAPGPFLGSVLGARLAAASGRSDAVAAILAGDERVGWAEPLTPADHVGERLHGQFTLLDTTGARWALALTPAGAALVETEPFEAPSDVPCLDSAVRLAVAAADDHPAAIWLPEGETGLFRRGLVLAAALLVGMAEATRDMAATYACTRVQFGKPIGSFQAIKHHCADMAVRAEAALAQTFLAAVTVAADQPDALFQATAAKVTAFDAAHRNAAANVHVHGGLGFTWEHDAHLYVKRAHVVDRMLGGQRSHLIQLLAQPSPQ